MGSAQPEPGVPSNNNVNEYVEKKRAELIKLSEDGEIQQSVKVIKKSLEKNNQQNLCRV